MTARTALPILVAALLTPAFAAAQAVGPDEAHGTRAIKPNAALTPAQKSAIYSAVSRRRLGTPVAEIPLVVGAPVPHSAPLLALPEEATDFDLAQYLKYATVDGNVVLVDSINMRVIDIIRPAVP
jgi:hypothetical protein